VLSAYLDLNHLAIHECSDLVEPTDDLKAWKGDYTKEEVDLIWAVVGSGLEFKMWHINP
jgi:hypothetical protein